MCPDEKVCKLFSAKNAEGLESLFPFKFLEIEWAFQTQRIQTSYAELYFNLLMFVHMSWSISVLANRTKQTHDSH